MHYMLEEARSCFTFEQFFVLGFVTLFTLCVEGVGRAVMERVLAILATWTLEIRCRYKETMHGSMPQIVAPVKGRHGSVAQVECEIRPHGVA